MKKEKEKKELKKYIKKLAIEIENI